MHAADNAAEGAAEDGVRPEEPAVRVYQGERLVGAYRLTGTGVTIGKAAGTDITVPGAQVSRVHARIAGEEGAWVLEDLGSTNGTFVYADERLVYSSRQHPGAWVLRDRQEIRLGPHPGEWRLIFSDPTSTDTSPPVFIDEPRREVWIRGIQVHLPRDHYAVLLALSRQAPAPCTYEALCAAINQERRARRRQSYDELVASDVESLHHLIHRLRARVEVDPKRPGLILQVHHVGYRLHNEADPHAS